MLCCVIRPRRVVMWFARLALSASLIIQYLALKTRTSSLQFTTLQLANYPHPVRCTGTKPISTGPKKQEGKFWVQSESVKVWWMEKVEKRKMGWDKHKEVRLVHEVKKEICSRIHCKNVKGEMSIDARWVENCECDHQLSESLICGVRY